MNLINKTVLLGKVPPLAGFLYHPIPFPNHNTVLIKRREAVARILEATKNYQDREFIITPDNYGLEISVNYVDGKFQSMILKGTGEQGEKVSDAIAQMLVPAEAKNKKAITLHALLTVLDLSKFRGGMTKYDVPNFIKESLLNGFPPYKDKEVVCRPYRIYIDGVLHDADFCWEEINPFLITGLSSEGNYDCLAANVNNTVQNNGYLLPERGVSLYDKHPEDEKAFPETHFLFDDEETFESSPS